MDHNKISPEAMRALMDFKMEVADELGIHTHNNMSKSEHSVRMSIYNEGKNLKSNNNIDVSNESNKATKEYKGTYNHDIY